CDSIRFFETNCARRTFFHDRRRRRRDEDFVDKCQRGVSVLPPFDDAEILRWIGKTRSQINRAVYRVENLKWDENDHPEARTKDAVAVVALDRNVCSQGVQVEIGTCKSIKNFTSALKNLELETIDRDPPELRTSDAQTDHFNDSEQEDNIPVFKTREISTFQLVIQGMEILNFQGTRHSPAEIAPYWKKDSRMWLWKSVRLARRIRKTKAKAVTPASTLYRENLS
ncbi:uncharacterized protein, partial [Polyergus mexicanus]|uniref:uncharacterized protein n=1 Tax=Polyergus mexicanus TaxID=615972 RepID=UPI0038B43EF2